MPLKALTLEVKKLSTSDSEEGLVGSKYLDSSRYLPRLGARH